MFVFGNLLLGIAKVIDVFLWFYMWVLIARVVISWVSADPYNPIVRAIAGITDPLLYRIRRSLPVVVGGIDLSPIVAFAAIYFLQIFLVNSMIDLAMRMR